MKCPRCGIIPTQDVYTPLCYTCALICRGVNVINKDYCIFYTEKDKSKTWPNNWCFTPNYKCNVPCIVHIDSYFNGKFRNLFLYPIYDRDPEEVIADPEYQRLLLASKLR